MKITKITKKSKDKFQPDDKWLEFDGVNRQELTLLIELAKAKMAEVAFFAHDADELSLASCARDDGSWDENFSLGDGVTVRIAPIGGADGYLFAYLYLNDEDLESVRLGEFRKFYIIAVSIVNIVSEESVLANVAHAAAALRGSASVEVYDD